MTSRRLLYAVVVPFFLMSVGLSQAQTTTTTEQIYRLTSKTSFEEGCFDPCLCFVHYSDDVIGTWRMTPGASDPLYAVYDITEVNWFLPALGYRVTGKGTYKIGGEFARTQQLSLDLVVGDRPVQHFDSGVVSGGADFPNINLTISINNLVCTDTVFHVSASPVLLQEIVPYALQSASYEEGCFGPCDCAVVSRPLNGRFGLLMLRAVTGEIDYAVLDIRWIVRDPNATTTNGSSVNGNGVYLTRDASTTTGTATGTQRMILDLIENGAGPTRFDSGVVPLATTSGGRFPRRVDIDVAEHGFACYDNVYSIHAKRRSSAVMDFNAIGTDPIFIGVESTTP